MRFIQKKQLHFFCIFLLLIFLPACFAGIQKQGSVLDYHQGRVKTEGGSFLVSPLPPVWQQQKIDYRAVLFTNAADQATITIDAWCRRATDDSSLLVQTNQLLQGIQNLHVTQQTKAMLAKRATLITEAYGFIDGRKIFITTTVLKMNACVFDFIYVSVPEKLQSHDDYQQMVNGFKYIKGPKLL